MTSIEVFQKSSREVASTALNETVYETMIRCAELNGYETVASFVKDAILDKISMIASAMKMIANENRSQAVAWYIGAFIALMLAISSFDSACARLNKRTCSSK